jgi:hypothetical protein
MSPSGAVAAAHALGSQAIFLTEGSLSFAHRGRLCPKSPRNGLYLSENLIKSGIYRCVADAGQVP